MTAPTTVRLLILQRRTDDPPGAPAGADTDLFVVVGQLPGRRMRITAASPLAAAAAADYWRTQHPTATADWFLRQDPAPDRLVLLFTRLRPAAPASAPTDGRVHATALVPGIPVSAHPVTACPQPLRWDQVSVCDPTLGQPCPGCLTQIRQLVRHHPPTDRAPAVPAPLHTSPILPGTDAPALARRDRHRPEPPFAQLPVVALSLTPAQAVERDGRVPGPAGPHTVPPDVPVPPGPVHVHRSPT